MSTLTNISPLNLSRSAITAPRAFAFDRSITPSPSPAIEQQETVKPVTLGPIPVEQSPQARVNTLKLDTAVEFNRKTTPQSVVDLRAAPRYSISQINSLSTDEIKSRMSQLDNNDRRPGWVKFLDLVDAPRNFIANTVTENFMPEAHRMAIERGDFDQFGQVKVFGSDMLRSMGIKNNVVNAVAGFLIDVATDPISFIGGPVGGLKTVGTRGAISISNRGQKVLRGGFKTLSNTGSTAGIVDDAARNLIEKTLMVGRDAGHIDDTTDAASLGAYVSNTLLGQQSKLSKAGEKVRLGGSTKGGALAEDFFDVTDDVVGLARKNGTLSPAVPGAQALGHLPGQGERVKAVKDFVAAHTNNGGFALGLSGKSGGAEIAHLPFTSKTLTAPAFNVAGIQFGNRAVVQKGIALALNGKAAGGRHLIRAAEESKDISRISDDINRLLDEKILGEQAGDDVSGVLDELINKQIELGEWHERAKVRKGQVPAGLNDLQSPETLGDFLATAQLEAAASADLRRAAASLAMSDIENGIQRGITEGTLSSSRRIRDALINEAGVKFELTPEEAFDMIAHPERRNLAMQDLIDLRTQHVDDRYADLIKLSDENLMFAESSIDGLHAVVEAAAESAKLRGGSVRRALSSDNRLMVDAAKKVMRISDDEIGVHPLSKFETMARSLGFTGWDTSIAGLGMSGAINLGGVGGIQQGVFQSIRRIAAGADDAGTAISTNFLKGRGEFAGSGGINGVAKAGGVKTGREYDLLSQWVTMKAEIALREASGFPPLVIKNTNADGAPTAAARFKQSLDAQGWLNNPEMVAKVDQLVAESQGVMLKYGEDMLARGEVDSLISAYLPSQLREGAAGRARALKQKGGVQAKIAERTSNALNDPTHGRSTNLVEFTDKDGVARSFMILESDVWRGVSDEDLLKLQTVDPQAAQRALEIRDDIRAFDEIFGADPETMRDISRPLLPFEINDYSSTGALDGLVGGPLMESEQLFETDMMKLLYNRTRSARVAEAETMFSEAINPYVLTKIGRDDHLALGSSNKPAKLETGEEIKRLNDGRYQVGGTTYRHMSDAQIDSTSLFVPELILGADSRNAIIPEPLVVAMERMNDTLKPGNMGPIMGLANKITTLFKVSTLSHPSWTVGNIFGNTVLVAMDDPRLLTDPKRAITFARHFKDASRMLSSNAFKKGYNPNRTIMVGGGPKKIGEILEMAREQGVVTGGGLAGDLTRQIIGKQSRRIAPESAASGAGNFASRTIGGAKDAYSERLAELTHLRGVGSGAASGADKARAVAEAGKTGLFKKAATHWFSVNGMVDDGYRLAHFMNLLDDGFDAATAGDRTRRAMLNFGDMTSFERNYVRPLIPFYAWTRASMPNFLMRTVRDPAHIAAVPKFTNAIEEFFVGEDKLPRWKRPGWLQQTLAVQLTKDPESRVAFQLGTLLPQEGAQQIISGGLGLAGVAGFDGQDLMDTLNSLYGNAGPAIKIPSELAFARESFTGRSISARAGEGDISLDDYLFKQVRAFKEFGIGASRQGPVQRAFDQSVGQGVGRLTVGGRFQGGLSEDSRVTALLFEMKDRESELRKNIRRAEKNGDDAADLRIEMFKVYANALSGGVDPSSIPKYAREELAAMGLYDQPSP